MDIFFDNEFRNLITPLQPDEREQLERSLKAEGNRDPMVVWKENKLMLDGHNRYDICTNAGIALKPAMELSFPDRNSAMVWIIKNQFGRRNLSRYSRSVLALKLDDILGQEAEKRMLAGKKIDPKPTLAQGEVRDEIAKIAHVSHGTLDKVKLIEEKATDEQKEKLVSGVKTINQIFVTIRREEVKKSMQEKYLHSPVVVGHDSGILPLEALRPDAESLLLGFADVSVRCGLEGLRKWCIGDDGKRLDKWVTEVACIPEAVAAVVNMEQAVKESERLIKAAAAELQRVAAAMPTDPIPWGAEDEEYRQVLIAQNAHQKNMAGYCREIECWEDAGEYGYCINHSIKVEAN